MQGLVGTATKAITPAIKISDRAKGLRRQGSRVGEGKGGIHRVEIKECPIYGIGNVVSFASSTKKRLKIN